jgi:metallo-beta-lactamase family protein
MDVRLKFLGGAQSVTGSKYLLEVDDYKLLVDCGLFQGLKKLRLRNWDEFPVETDSIDAILLTHAHLDHSGYVPRLVAQGYDKNIYCTASTAALLEILWKDSAKLQKEEADFVRQKGYSKHKNPTGLYTEDDVESALKLIKTVDFNQTLELNEVIHAKWSNAGHILGASSIELTLRGTLQQKTIIFSGDIGRQKDPVMLPPSTYDQADVVLIESTYGDRINILDDIESNLALQINETLERGVVLIPAFTVGRTQSLLFMLRQLMKANKIPDVPVYIDSPMAISVTKLYEQFDQEHRLHDKDIFEDKNFHYIRSAEASAGLKDLKKRAIIISASGMITGGRILNHLFHRIENEHDLLLFVGYQADGTRGRDILEGKDEIKIFGEYRKVKCKTYKIDGLSAHADQTELIQWFNHIKDNPKFTFLVHGELEAANEMKKLLAERSLPNLIIPDYLESFELFQGI